MNIESERAAFEVWYETTYGISLEPEFRANHFIGYVNDKANHRWTAWQARAALSAPSHGEQVREQQWQLIHDTLRNYRMGTLSDGEGGGYPLIDAMTADGQPVSGGIEECTYLADAIWNVLAAAPSAGSQGGDV